MDIDFQVIEKVKEEYSELKYRYDKLAVFLDKQKEEQTVSDRQAELLMQQWLFMQGYMNVIELRIKDLENWMKKLAKLFQVLVLICLLSMFIGAIVGIWIDVNTGVNIFGTGFIGAVVFSFALPFTLFWD